MHAFLITGRNPDLIQSEIQKLLTKLKAKKFNFTVQKIADIRELERFTRLKMLEKTAIVIQDFENATEEAQNAFLKALEEPQENLFYILTTAMSELLLPTIVSRCQLIEIRSVKQKLQKEEKEEIKKFLEMPVGEKLKTTANVKNREEAIALMNKIMLVLRDNIFQEDGGVEIIENAKRTLVRLKANGNVQLQLTNFVVNLDQNHLAPRG